MSYTHDAHSAERKATSTADLRANQDSSIQQIGKTSQFDDGKVEAQEVDVNYARSSFEVNQVFP